MNVELQGRGRDGVRYSTMASPVGELLLSSDGAALTGIAFATGKRGRPRTAVPADWTRDDSALADARAQLEQYFAGQRVEFELPLKPIYAGARFRLFA